jgi:crotonobetainyl-CoA:carnitine CoA-transferase CaiB-like acyl-CoA transferase
LLALIKKGKTRKGSLVEVSLYDAALSSLKNQATNWLMNNFIPQPTGSLHPNIAPYGETFKTKDGELLVLAIGNNKHFKMLLNVLGADKLLKNKNYETNQLRVINRTDLNNDLKVFFNKKTKNELMSQFLELNIPVGVINNLKEVFDNKNAQDLILEETIDGVNTKRVKTAIFKISD